MYNASDASTEGSMSSLAQVAENQSPSLPALVLIRIAAVRRSSIPPPPRLRIVELVVRSIVRREEARLTLQKRRYARSLMRCIVSPQCPCQIQECLGDAISRCCSLSVRIVSLNGSHRIVLWHMSRSSNII